MAIKRGTWAGRAQALRGATTRAVEHRPFDPAELALVASPPSGPGWLHEIKWDGYRLTTTLVANKARVWSRQAVDWTDRLGPIARALEQLPVTSAILDGELIAGGGRQAEFNVLQESIAARETDGLSLVLFDLLNLDGIDVTAASTLERRELLAQLLSVPIPRLALSTHIVGEPDAALLLSRREGFEGVVSKPADAAYPLGKRGVWFKAKNERTEKLVVVGSLSDHVLLARPHNSGWQYAGRARPLSTLPPLLTSPTTEAPTQLTQAQKRRLSKAQWFEPVVFVEVDHRAVQRGRESFRHLKILRVVTDGTPHG